MGAFFTEAGRFIVAFKHRNILGHKLKSCASEPLPFFMAVWIFCLLQSRMWTKIPPKYQVNLLSSEPYISLFLHSPGYCVKYLILLTIFLLAIFN